MGTRQGSPPNHADDALAKLLTAESHLAERLAAAHEHAAEIVQRAREDAARAEAACAATIEARSAQLTEDYEERTLAEIADMTRESQLQSARFAAVDERRLREYVAFVIERLLATGPAERST